MGSVFRGPSSRSPTPREEGVVWSYVSLWTPGSLSRAITPPQNPKTPQDPALLGLEPGRGLVIRGCPELAGDTYPGGRRRVGGEVRRPRMQRSGSRWESRVACVPLRRRITSSEIRMTT